MSPFQSLHEYEEFVYTLPNRYPFIHALTLVVARRGAKAADLAGELMFDQGLRLGIHEHFTFYDGPITLRRYSYGAWRGDERLYWYDPQPHPNNPDLALNHPITNMCHRISSTIAFRPQDSVSPNPICPF